MVSPCRTSAPLVELRAADICWRTRLFVCSHLFDSIGSVSPLTQFQQPFRVQPPPGASVAAPRVTHSPRPRDARLSDDWLPLARALLGCVDKSLTNQPKFSGISMFYRVCLFYSKMRMLHRPVVGWWSSWWVANQQF